MSQNRDDRDNFYDHEDRKKNRFNRRKDHSKLDRPSGDKRIKRVGNGDKWRFDPRKMIGEENEYEEEDWS